MIKFYSQSWSNGYSRNRQGSSTNQPNLGAVQELESLMRLIHSLHIVRRIRRVYMIELDGIKQQAEV